MAARSPFFCFHLGLRLPDGLPLRCRGYQSVPEARESPSDAVGEESPRPVVDLSCLPTSLESHQSSLPFSVTAWTHATRMALTLSGTTPYVIVRVWSLASAALAFFIHRLWCSLNIRCVSTQTPTQVMPVC